VSKNSGRIQTVNVLEILQSDPCSVRSFEDSEEGNLQAEKLFSELIRENDSNVGPEDIKESITDGHWTGDYYSVWLIHSQLT